MEGVRVEIEALVEEEGRGWEMPAISRIFGEPARRELWSLSHEVSAACAILEVKPAVIDVAAADAEAVLDNREDGVCLPSSERQTQDEFALANYKI